MKKLLLIILLLINLGAFAQIVNIPDPVFKDKLLSASPTSVIARDFNGIYITIDANDDGEIQLSEALAVRDLQVHTPGPEGMHPQIETLEGINSFSNLEYLGCFGNALTELDVTGLVNLKGLRTHSNDLISINVSGLTNLEQLSFHNNNVTAIDLSDLVNLKSLHCPDNLIATLDVSNLVNLESLTCSNNLLTSLDVQNLTLLEIFACESCDLTTVDLSNSPNLRQVRVSNSFLLQHINLKNGGILGQPQYCTFSGCPNLEYICIDEGEEAAFEIYYQETQSSQLNTTSYCSFTPGGDHNTITATVSFDNNNNGCITGSNPIPFSVVSIADGTNTGTGYSNYSGQCNFFTQEGTFTLTPELENDWFIVNPESATITFNNNNNNIETQNFCLTANGVHPDVHVLMAPLGNAQPGFEVSYIIFYGNRGNQTASGEIILSFDGEIIDYISSSPAGSPSSGTITWTYENLLPFQGRVIILTLEVNSPQDTPPVEIGDELQYSVSIPLSGDEIPDDNVYGTKHTVVGSFDPNDITCLEGDTASPDKIGDYLHYNINFENTGNAAATFIVVKDIINEEQFDINSLQLLYASHDVEVRVQDNKVEFYFDDIQLGSLEKGNVLFKVKTKNTLQVNDDVTQQAEIFFDYNWPIITNEATTVFQVLSAGDFEVDNSVKIYPNPAVSFINISAESNINSLQLYDVQGRLLQAASSETNTAKLDISARAAGIYFIKIITEAGVKVEKIVKK